ncbi:MAG TPA: hypothetical protein VJ986_06180, partial [Gaiellaceae bacterium]|nr:hypothetical protein [Gaiellaceae bacterium]
NRHAVAAKRVKIASRVSGYWVVYVDGRRAAVSRLAGRAVLRRLAPGRHTVRLELLRESGRHLAPRALSAPARVTIPTRVTANRVGGEA